MLLSDDLRPRECLVTLFDSTVEPLLPRHRRQALVQGRREVDAVLAHLGAMIDNAKAALADVDPDQLDTPDGRRALAEVARAEGLHRDAVDLLSAFPTVPATLAGALPDIHAPQHLRQLASAFFDARDTDPRDVPGSGRHARGRC